MFIMDMLSRFVGRNLFPTALSDRVTNLKLKWIKDSVLRVPEFVSLPCGAKKTGKYAVCPACVGLGLSICCCVQARFVLKLDLPFFFFLKTNIRCCSLPENLSFLSCFRKVAGNNRFYLFHASSTLDFEMGWPISTIREISWGCTYLCCR